MRKIPKRFENPLDSIIIEIADYIQPVFYSLGFVPNVLTTISLITWLFAMYFFITDYKNYTFYAVLLIVVSYFFDCADGHFARSYGMVSKFGDYYDHIADIFKIALFIYLVYMKFASKFLIVFGVLAFFAILTFMHLSCQELYYGSYSDTFYIMKYLCIANKQNVNSFMPITKYFGCGMLYLVLIMCVIYMKSKTHRPSNDRVSK